MFELSRLFCLNLLRKVLTLSRVSIKRELINSFSNSKPLLNKLYYSILYILDVNNLIKSVKSVTKSTRSARTVVWCAVQMLYTNCATSNNNSNDISPSGDWWGCVLNDYIIVTDQLNYPHSLLLPWHWPLILLEITKFKRVSHVYVHVIIWWKVYSFSLLAGLFYIAFHASMFYYKKIKQ